MDFKTKCRIGFGFEKPKSVHLCYLPQMKLGKEEIFLLVDTANNHTADIFSQMCIWEYVCLTETAQYFDLFMIHACALL